MMLPWCCLCGK